MYLYSLSFHMTTFAPFFSYENPTNCILLSYFNNSNKSFVIKFKPFPEPTDILLREQSETSGGYCGYKRTLEGAVYSPNVGFRKSIPRGINSPLPSRK